MLMQSPHKNSYTTLSKCEGCKEAKLSWLLSVCAIICVTDLLDFVPRFFLSIIAASEGEGGKLWSPPEGRYKIPLAFYFGNFYI